MAIKIADLVPGVKLYYVSVVSRTRKLLTPTGTTTPLETTHVGHLVGPAEVLRSVRFENNVAIVSMEAWPEDESHPFPIIDGYLTVYHPTKALAEAAAKEVEKGYQAGLKAAQLTAPAKMKSGDHSWTQDSEGADIVVRGGTRTDARAVMASVHAGLRRAGFTNVQIVESPRDEEALRNCDDPGTVLQELYVEASPVFKSKIQLRALIGNEQLVFLDRPPYAGGFGTGNPEAL